MACLSIWCVLSVYADFCVCRVNPFGVCSLYTRYLWVVCQSIWCVLSVYADFRVRRVNPFGACCPYTRIFVFGVLIHLLCVGRIRGFSRVTRQSIWCVLSVYADFRVWRVNPFGVCSLYTRIFVCGALIHMVCAVRVRGIFLWCVNPFGVCCPYMRFLRVACICLRS